jgi:hypothetical protein
MKNRKLAALLASGALLLGLMAGTAGVAGAFDNPIAWTGNGVTDGQVNDEQCDENNTPYLYWVFASSKGVTGATITFGGTGSGSYPMNDDNGTWKLQNGPWFELDGLTASVSYTGTPEAGNPHLTISHGCPGETEESAPPSFEQSQEGETDAPSVPVTDEPSFEQSQQGETDAPSEPQTDAISGTGNSAPADGAWLLVVALGVLLASVVVLTPARAKGRR